MEYLDKLIPLAVLGAVGAFLLLVLLRAARERDATPRSEALPIRVEPVAMKVEKPVVGEEKKQVPIPAVMKRDDENVAVLISVVPDKARRKRKKPAPPAVATVVPAETPIERVLDLLKEKDTLAAAFVLHEILAPPVSKPH